MALPTPRVRFVPAVVILLCALRPVVTAQVAEGSHTSATDLAERRLRSTVGAPGRLLRSEDGLLRIAGAMRLPTFGGNPRARAEDVLRRYGAAFGIASGTDLRFERQQRIGTFTVVRFRRHAFGLPVLLRSVVVRLRLSGEADVIFAAPGPTALGVAPAAIDEGGVEADALGRVGARPGRTATARAVGLDVDGAIVRGYVVDVRGQSRTDRRVLLYDARDGTLLASVSGVMHARGRVYDPNPPVAMDMTTDVELPRLTSLERLTGQGVRASACGAAGPSCTPLQSAMADEAGDFLFDPVEPSFEDPFAEVSAYFHADRVSRYFEDTHGFTWTCCGGSEVMEVVANYWEERDTSYDNAAYTPSACSRDECGAIVLGQGARHDYAYDGDVVYHEFTHAIVDETAGIFGIDLDALGISYEPMAINEGTADYYAGVVGGNSSVAEYFAGMSALGSSGSLREMENDLVCPNDLFGEGHMDGRIWAGALWEARQSIEPAAMDALVFATLGTMSDNTIFDDAAALLLSTAETLREDGVLGAADLTLLEGVLGDRGIAGCRRIVPLDDGEPHLGYSGTELATGSLGGSVVPLHYRIDIPADAAKLTLYLVPLTDSGSYTYYLRDGQPARFVAGRRPPLVHDTSIEAARMVELDDGSVHPLPRCETLYIALIADDLHTVGESAYRLTAVLDRTGEPTEPCTTSEDGGVGPGDAGVDAADGAPGPSVAGGGGCSVPLLRPAPADPVLWLAALWVLSLVRRRARRTGGARRSRCLRSGAAYADAPWRR